MTQLIVITYYFMPPVVKVFLILSASFLTVALIAGGFYWYFRNSYDDLLKNGSKITGAIIDKNIRHGRYGYSCFAQYEYVWQGTKYSAKSRVKQAFFETLQLKSPINVLVDAKNPEKSTIDLPGDVIFVPVLVFMILTIVFGSLGAGFLMTSLILLGVGRKR